MGPAQGGQRNSCHALVANQLWLPDARSAAMEAVCTPGRCWLRSAA